MKGRNQKMNWKIIKSLIELDEEDLINSIKENETNINKLINTKNIYNIQYGMEPCLGRPKVKTKIITHLFPLLNKGTFTDFILVVQQSKIH